MNTYKISVPKPCHEDWNTMTPDDKGRFCANCSKTVIDFSEMTDVEIKSYLIVQKGKSVCGHFRTSQLQRITITIPAQVLYSQTQFHKIFLLALLFTMGTTLLSCADEAGNKQKIENVVIEEEETTSTVEDIDSVSDVGVEGKVVLTPRPQIHLTGAVAVEPCTPAPLTGEVVFEPDSIKTQKIKQLPQNTMGKVALDFSPKKEDSHIQGDTIITPLQ
ncbi:hypothetical protein E0W68_12685 [Flavobacterium salilacus subsp. salilacus]|uniref:hypothetical protein n=1 Tax=Flavobacterium TaxID=237 RepID=UPI00107511EF|nr:MULTISPECIES: hypothetical protein [Flavobacterium]KAF2515803.1 hypothetical protein E0W68_12685 [Flavobacterium salilacus subsp. salilacus]MBE1615395.1 hypothetical protein [Flavobacterium sp. SaA2.13]